MAPFNPTCLSLAISYNSQRKSTARHGRRRPVTQPASYRRLGSGTAGGLMQGHGDVTGLDSCPRIGLDIADRAGVFRVAGPSLVRLAGLLVRLVTEAGPGGCWRRCAVLCLDRAVVDRLTFKGQIVGTGTTSCRPRRAARARLNRDTERCDQSRPAHRPNLQLGSSASQRQGHDRPPDPGASSTRPRDRDQQGDHGDRPARSGHRR